LGERLEPRQAQALSDELQGQLHLLDGPVNTHMVTGAHGYSDRGTRGYSDRGQGIAIRNWLLDALVQLRIAPQNPKTPDFCFENNIYS